MTTVSAQPVVSRSTVVRVALVAVALLVLTLIGQSAARATESLAIGIMAANLVFLLIVSIWSSIATGQRRAYR